MARRLTLVRALTSDLRAIVRKKKKNLTSTVLMTTRMIQVRKRKIASSQVSSTATRFSLRRGL
jgi:hypothetical protein